MARALRYAVLVIASGCIDEGAAVAGARVEIEVESLLQRPASVRDQILHIVDFREELIETSVPDELVALKRRFVSYYSEVGSHIKHSVHTDLGQTVDCIPFLKQPALLWAGEEVKKEAVALAKSTGDAQDAAGEQEANQEQEHAERYGCRPDQVPLPRPSLQALRRGLIQEFRKTGSPTGGLWPSAREHQSLALLQVGKDDCRTIRPPHPGPPNHTYSTSPICKTHGSRTAFAVLELTGAPAEVPSSGGHTLNQLWWKGVPPESKLPVSLEAGWLTNDLTGISDARSSQRIGTRLFVYSTPNAYLPKDDCEGGNGYDHWGGFVQYPGAPPLGVYSVNKLRSVFLYKTVGSTAGMPERVEFYLAKLGKDYGKPRSVASKRHLVGYWPKSHFCQGFPKHEDLLLYTGLEVFVPSQCPGMPRTASGRILGWGTEWNAGDPEFYPMLKDEGSESVFLATAKQEWQASVGYDAKWEAPYVDFSGTYRPVSCVVPGKLPCEDITCPRR